jgi:hypothetical protein
LETGFADFWSVYPNRKAKQDAERAWSKLNHSPELLADILAAVDAQAVGKAWTKDDGAFVPHAATWINGKRWLDDVEPVGATETFAGCI